VLDGKDRLAGRDLSQRTQGLFQRVSTQFGPLSRQASAEFRFQYAARACIEGTHAQAIRRCGLRRCRYLGLAKAHLQHVLTAVAIDLVRLGEWWAGTPPTGTRCSRFAALKPAA
jgi:transposase